MEKKYFVLTKVSDEGRNRPTQEFYNLSTAGW